MRLTLETKMIEPVLGFITDSQAGSIFRAIINYSLGKDYNIDDSVENVFYVIKDEIDACRRKNSERSEKAKMSVLSRWRKKTTEEVNEPTIEVEPTPIEEDVLVIEPEQIELVEPVPQPPKKRVKKEFDYSFVEEPLREAFELWLKYKRERGSTYNLQRTLVSCYNNLKKLSNGDPTIAMEIVNQSISNNYQGLFPIKTKSNYGNRQVDTQEQQRYDLARGCAERVANEYADPNYNVPPIFRK